MNGKGYLLLTLIVFVSILIISLFSMPVIDTHGKDAYIRMVVHKEEVQVNEKDTWNITVHNTNISENNQGRDGFFFKFYLDDQIFWNEYNDTNYKFWQCNKTHTTSRMFIIPTWSSLSPNWSSWVPATSAFANFRVELYWYHNVTGTADLQDSTSFTVGYVSFIRILHPMALAYLLIYAFMSLVLLFNLSPQLRRLIMGE